MRAEILVFEDDPDHGAMVCCLIRDAGYSVHLFVNLYNALDTVVDYQPKLVFSDIMMPGMDGVSFCRLIKSDPRMRATKVVICSGKTLLGEKERALKAGADLFLEKGFDTETFADLLRKLIGVPSRHQASPSTAVEVEVWGARSEAATGTAPSTASLTSCVSLTSKFALIILDAGSGLVNLSRRLAQNQAAQNLWVLVSHFHRDHIAGLGSLAAAGLPGLVVNLGTPTDPSLQIQPYFHSVFRNAAIQVNYYQLLEQAYHLTPHVRLTTCHLNHPGVTLGMSVELEGRKIVYCPANELRPDSPGLFSDFHEKLTVFCRGADLLIHDARYTEEDYANHPNEGFSAWPPVLDLALGAGVRKLVLFHLDPSYGAEVVSGLEVKARERLRAEMTGLECVVAREGMRLEL